MNDALMFGIYRYKPVHRPAGTHTLPRGIDWRYCEAPPDLAHRRPDIPPSVHRYGIIATDRALTAEECEHFSLEPQ